MCSIDIRLFKHHHGHTLEQFNKPHTSLIEEEKVGTRDNHE